MRWYRRSRTLLTLSRDALVLSKRIHRCSLTLQIVSAVQVHEALTLLERQAELATISASVSADDGVYSGLRDQDSEFKALRLGSVVAAQCRNENIELAERVRAAEERCSSSPVRWMFVPFMCVVVLVSFSVCAFVSVSVMKIFLHFCLRLCLCLCPRISLCQCLCRNIQIRKELLLFGAVQKAFNRSRESSLRSGMFSLFLFILRRIFRGVIPL